MPVVSLLIELLAGQPDLSGVDNQDVVTGVHVRGVDGLVLPAQDLSDAARQAAERLPFGVYEIPPPGDLVRGHLMGLHRKSPRGSKARAGARNLNGQKYSTGRY
jgi:hypothetical protein